jgi:hypothetical protein
MNKTTLTPEQMQQRSNIHLHIYDLRNGTTMYMPLLQHQQATTALDAIANELNRLYALEDKLTNIESNNS